MQCIFKSQSYMMVSDYQGRLLSSLLMLILLFFHLDMEETERFT